MLLAGFCRTAAAAKLPPRYKFGAVLPSYIHFLFCINYKSGAFRLRFYSFVRYYNLTLSDVDVDIICKIYAECIFFIYNCPKIVISIISIFPTKLFIL